MKLKLDENLGTMAKNGRTAVAWCRRDARAPRMQEQSRQVVEKTRGRQIGAWVWPGEERPRCHVCGAAGRSGRARTTLGTANCLRR